jgi:hypothetical protein
MKYNMKIMSIHRPNWLPSHMSIPLVDITFFYYNKSTQIYSRHIVTMKIPSISLTEHSGGWTHVI